MECPNIVSFTVASNNPVYAAFGGGLYNKDKTRLHFVYQKSLAAISLADTLQGVATDAFKNCENLEKVNLSWSSNSSRAYSVYYALIINFSWLDNQPDGILVIGDWLLGYKGTVPNELIIPEGVRGINYMPYCESLSIPASVEQISESEFAFSSVETLEVASENQYYCSSNGVLFNKGKTRLIFAAKGLSGLYVVPNTVVEINYNAFYACKSLTAIYILDNVETIGDEAFAYCETLETIELYSTKVASIGSDAFEGTAWFDNQADGCVVLGSWIVGFKGAYPETLQLPDGVTRMVDDVFPYDIKINDTYSYASDVKNLILPTSLTNIDWTYIYNRFYNLESICFRGSDPQYFVDDKGVLFNKAKTRLIRAPGGITGSYTIPSTVQVIENYAFEDCCNLVRVVIPNSVTSIGVRAFSYCENLNSVSLGSGVRRIGYRAFRGTPLWNSDDECDDYKEGVVTLGGWVIGANSYWDDDIEEYFPSVTIPANVKGIADGAFVAYFDGDEEDEEDWKDLDNCDGIYFSTITIPSSVQYVGKWIFADNAELKTIYIPQHLAGYANQLAFGTSARVVIGSNVGGGAVGGSGGGGGNSGSMPDTEQPCLKQENFTFETYKDFGVENEYEIFNLQGGKVSLKKVDGKLPSGVRLKYDKKTDKVVLSGSPSKAGTFEYVFRIDEKVGRETREGFETTFRFVVKDMKQVSPSDPGYNPAAGKKVKTDVPIFAKDGTLVGLLSVSISTKNVISAKIKGASSRALSFKGKWQEVVDGDLCAIMTTKSGEELELVLKKDGNLCAYLSNINGAYGSELASTEQGVAAVATDADFAQYVTDKAGRIVEVDTPNGPVQVELKITKKGKVTYKSPTDKSIKGSAQVLLNAYEDGAAQICLVKTTGKTPYAYVIRLDTF